MFRMIHDHVCLAIYTQNSPKLILRLKTLSKKDDFVQVRRQRTLRAGGGPPPHCCTSGSCTLCGLNQRLEGTIYSCFLDSRAHSAPARSPLFTRSLFLRHVQAPSIHPCLALITQEVIRNKHRRVECSHAPEEQTNGPTEAGRSPAEDR